MFIRDGAPFSTFAMAADMAPDRAASSVASPAVSAEFAMTRDDTATEAADATEAI